MSLSARSAPAVMRNREPIARILRDQLADAGGVAEPRLVLEIASGTGEHAVWFSRILPAVMWQPTDRDPEALASIEAWRNGAGLENLLQPLRLDAAAPASWPLMRADAVVAINMIHIAPWSATEGLLTGAARVLPVGGLLFLYGPFREGGTALAAGNEAFDADLRARDPDWGLRELGAVVELAGRCGIGLEARIAMPANNLSLVFRRAGGN